jgi:hypothetical protein
MNIVKRFKEFLSPKTLEEYLLDNYDKHIELIEKMTDDVDSQIYIASMNNSNRLFNPPKMDRLNLNNWKYFGSCKNEIYLIVPKIGYHDGTAEYSNILQIKEIGKYEDTQIFITKPVDIKIEDVRDAIKKESGYIWETIDELIFHTFNNDPEWEFNLSHYKSEGIIILEIFRYDIKSHIDKSDKQEFEKYIKWIKKQLEIITGHPFQIFTNYKTKKSNTLNSCSIKFILDYPKL